MGMGWGREDLIILSGSDLPFHGGGVGIDCLLKPHQKHISLPFTQHRPMNLVTGASKPSDLPVLAVVRGCEASVLRAVDHTGYTDRSTP